MSLEDLIAAAGERGDDVADLFAYFRTQGIADTEIADAALNGDLTSLEFDRRLRLAELTLDDLAAASSATPDEIVEAYRLMGIPVDDSHGPMFDQAEQRIVELVRAAAAALPAGMTEEILRSIGAGIATVAESAVAAYVGSVEDLYDDRSLREKALATNAVGSLALELGTLLGPLLRHHLWIATYRQREAMREALDRRQSTLTVGFVDLVGFTSTTESMTPDALLAFMRGFHSTAFDIVTSAGGRLVKHIGDEIMFTAASPERACTIALDLLDGFPNTGSRPRAGLAHGVVVARHGDVYGPVVNTAARLTDIAVSGEVLAEAHIGALLDDSNRFLVEPAGRRQLKGFSEPTRVVSIDRVTRDP
jgi:adenylate cyclase